MSLEITGWALIGLGMFLLCVIGFTMATKRK